MFYLADVLTACQVDFLQLLIDARADDEPAEPETTRETSSFSSSSSSKKFLTDEEIVSLVTLFVTVGADSTSNTLAFASYLLAINPEKQDKLCADIDAYYENNDEVGE